MTICLQSSCGGVAISTTLVPGLATGITSRQADPGLRTSFPIDRNCLERGVVFLRHAAERRILAQRAFKPGKSNDILYEYNGVMRALVPWID